MDEWYNVRIALLFAALYCIMRIIELGEWYNVKQRRT